MKYLAHNCDRIFVMIKASLLSGNDEACLATILKGCLLSVYSIHRNQIGDLVQSDIDRWLED
jgi:hypothetical protein